MQDALLPSLHTGEDQLECSRRNQVTIEDVYVSAATWEMVDIHTYIRFGTRGGRRPSRYAKVVELGSWAWRLWHATTRVYDCLI